MEKRINIWVVEDKYKAVDSIIAEILGANNYNLKWTVCMTSAFVSIEDIIKGAADVPDLMAFDLMIPLTSNEVEAKCIVGETIGRKTNDKDKIDFYENYIKDINVRQNFADQNQGVTVDIAQDGMIYDGGILLFGHLITKLESKNKPECIIYSANPKLQQQNKGLTLVGVKFYGKSLFPSLRNNENCYWVDKYQKYFRDFLWAHTQYEDDQYIINGTNFEKLPSDPIKFVSLVVDHLKLLNDTSVWFESNKIVKDVVNIEINDSEMIITKKEDELDDYNDSRKTVIQDHFDNIIRKKINNGEVYLGFLSLCIDEIINRIELGENDLSETMENARTMLSVLEQLPLIKVDFTGFKIDQKYIEIIYILKELIPEHLRKVNKDNISYWTFRSLFGHKINEFKKTIQENNSYKLQELLRQFQKLFCVRDLCADFSEAFNMYAVKQATHAPRFIGGGDTPEEMANIFESQLKKIETIVKSTVPKPVYERLTKQWVKSNNVITHINSFNSNRPLLYDPDKVYESLQKKRQEGFQFSLNEIIDEGKSKKEVGNLLFEKERKSISIIGKEILGDGIITTDVEPTYLFLPIHTLYEDLFKYLFARIYQKSFLNGAVKKENQRVSIFDFRLEKKGNEEYIQELVYIAIKTTGAPFDSRESLLKNDIVEAFKKGGFEYFGRLYISSLVDKNEQITINAFDNNNVNEHDWSKKTILSSNTWLEIQDENKSVNISNNWVNLFLFEFTKKESRPK